MDLKPENSTWNDFEASLARLAPRPAAVDRDQLMFLAGQASAGRGSRRPMIAWLTGASLAANMLLALTLGATWVSSTPPIERRAAVGELAQSESDASDSRAANAVALGVEAQPELRYLTLRRLVLQRGVDALPDLPSGSSGAPFQVLRKSEIGRALEQLPQG